MRGLMLAAVLIGLQQPPGSAPAVLTGTVFEREAAVLPGVTVTLEGAAGAAAYAYERVTQARRAPELLEDPARVVTR